MLGGPLQVKLLAFLLLCANRALPGDAVIDAVWGSEREGAARRLQTGVFRLRKALAPLDGPDGPRLRTVSGGYLLDLGPGELDAEVFAERVRDGRHALGRAIPIMPASCSPKRWDCGAVPRWPRSRLTISRRRRSAG